MSTTYLNLEGGLFFTHDDYFTTEHIREWLLMQNEANERKIYKLAQTLAKKLLLTLKMVRDFICDMCSVVWTALVR